MITIHFVTSFILQFVPSGIQPTLVHIPVVIASIIYGPRTGAILGLLMGLFSLTMNTLVITPASYLFSPFVPHGNLYSLIIAIVPRILIGVTPLLRLSLDSQSYRTYDRWNCRLYDQYFFVLSGIYFFFGNSFGGGIQHFLALIISTNSLIEVIATVLITSAVVPSLEKLK